jgi:hypothetical protein
MVAEDLDFTAKKKAIAQFSPTGAYMLPGTAVRKYRQLLEAKCGQGRCRSDQDWQGLRVHHRRGEVRTATRRECACCCGRHRPSRAEFLSAWHASARLFVFRCEADTRTSNARIRGWLPSATLMRCTDRYVYRAVARRRVVRKAPMCVAPTSQSSVWSTVSSAKTIRICRFLNLQTSGR